MKKENNKAFSTDTMKKNETLKLWPNSLKKWSIPMNLTGIIMLTLYQRGIKPAWLNVKVFAVASTYLENRYLQIVQSNIMDEIGFACLVSGISLLIFTKEKYESKQIQNYRLKAFLMATKSSLILWLVVYGLFFGFIIFPFSILIFPFFLILYYALFRYLSRNEFSKLKQ